MKKLYVGFFLQFLFTALLYPQINSVTNVTDFKISTDNSPSTIQQSNPKIFIKDTSLFLITWQDLRNGINNTYAQVVSASGIPSRSNFKINSDFDIAINEDNNIFSLNERFTDYYNPNYWFSSVSYIGSIQKPSASPGKEFTISTFPIPWCGTGYLGTKAQVVAMDNNFFTFPYDNGSLLLHKFYSSGKAINGVYLDSTLLHRVTNFSSTVTEDKKLALACFYIGPVFYDSTQYSGYGIYLNFFDSSGVIISKNIPIKKYPQDDNYLYNLEYSPKIKICSLSDTSLFLYWVDVYKEHLYYTRLDSDGNILSGIDSIKISYNENNINYRIIADVATSQICNDAFAVYLRLREVDNNSHDMYTNQLFTFSSDGEYISSIIDTGRFSCNYSQFFKASDNNYFFASTKNGDIYLDEYKDFVSINSIKINDDLEGSNERNPNITAIDNNRNFLSWNNESVIKGQVLDNQYSAINDPVVLKSRTICFSSSGKAMNNWIKSTDDEIKKLGYTIYDSNFNIIDEDTITSTSAYDALNNVVKISDSLYVHYVVTGSRILLRLLDVNFNLIKEESIQHESSIYSARIFKESDNAFWLYLPASLQIYNLQLQPISSEYKRYASEYLGNRIFIVTDLNSYEEAYGIIYSVDGDTISNKITFAPEANNLWLKVLPNNNFLAIWNTDEAIYAQAYSDSGKPIDEQFVIHSDSALYPTDANVLLKNNKLFFTWSDARNEGRGYDIYGSIFDLSKVVSVDNYEKVNLPNQFSLSQNYPNPFNPTTKIKFTIPVETGHAPSLRISLKVYDILGKEVATLVNEEKPAGNYEIEFDGSNLSSGVYFYQLSTYGGAGNFIETKKLIILK